MSLYLSMLFIVTHVTVIRSVNVTFESTIEARCLFSETCFPSQEAMFQLNEEMDGTLYLPHMDEYKTYALAYNTYEQRYPAIVAMVKSASDIQAAILWARKYNLLVTVRSSGHCYLGRSTWDGSFNINLAWMRDMEVKLDSNRSEHGELKTQTGLKWIEIYEKVNQSGRVVVGGSAHTVSPGGYTLGGGHSPISRSHGYAVDNVLEFQIVLADGTIAVCTEAQCDMVRPNGTTFTDTSGDLFWAVRGGGGSAFGVVVYFVYKLHLDVPQMVHAVGTFPFKVQIPALGINYDITSDVMDAMGALVQNLPKEWGGYWLLDNSVLDFVDDTLKTRIIVHGKVTIAMNKFAPWDGTEKDVFSDFLALNDEYDLDFTFTNRSGFLDYEKTAYDPPTIRTTFFAVLLQNSSFNESFKSFMTREIFETYPAPEVIGCTFIMLGARTTEFPLDSTPLNNGYRTASASLTCGVLLGAVDDKNYFQASEFDSILTAKADRSAGELRQFGEGMYFNEASKNNPHWREDFWNDYPRLLRIKQKYDPNNRFTCHQCVGSEEYVLPVNNTSDENINDDDTSGVSRVTSGLASIVFFILLKAI